MESMFGGFPAAAMDEISGFGNGYASAFPSIISCRNACDPSV